MIGRSAVKSRLAHSEAFLAKTQGFRALDSKEEQNFTKAFQQIKLGA
jgi:hypothetical protein